MSYSTRKIFSILTGLIIACSIAGCGGTKILKEPVPMQAAQPLESATDDRLTATLDWVIVRDGPGTWARNADWDEYLLSISNKSDQPVQIIDMTIVDSLGVSVNSQFKRKDLVKSSKQTAKRYKDAGIKVRAGRGASTLIVGGTVMTTLGVGAAATAPLAGFGTASAAGGTAATATGLLLIGPALAVGGIVRGVNNSKVNKEIEQRQTVLPIEIAAGRELGLDVFFPITPSPKSIELTYVGAEGERRLVIGTDKALRGLHLQSAQD